MIGALIGFAIAFLDLIFVFFISSRRSFKGNPAFIRVLTLPILIIFPVLGYFVGPMVVH